MSFPAPLLFAEPELHGRVGPSDLVEPHLLATGCQRLCVNECVFPASFLFCGVLAHF